MSNNNNNNLERGNSFSPVIFHLYGLQYCGFLWGHNKAFAL